MTIFGNRNQEMPDGLDPWVEGRNDPDHPFRRAEDERYLRATEYYLNLLKKKPVICNPCLCGECFKGEEDEI